MRKILPGGWGYDPDSTEELTVLPQTICCFGCRGGGGCEIGGVGGEEEGRGMKEREEENIVDPMESLKVIHGFGYMERQGCTTLQKLGVRIGRSPNRERKVSETPIFEGEVRIEGEARERPGEGPGEGAR